MRLLKIGMIVCAVTLGVGIIGTGATLGNLYKTSQLAHEIQLEEKLDTTALNNIYITSSVPMRIETTTGEPMVTFNGSLTGLIIPEPRYEIDVRTQGDSSYIDIQNKSNTIMDFYFGGLYEEAVVYLPQQTINKLKIVNGNDRIDYQGKVDINELIIESGYANLSLEGNFNKVDLNVGRSDIDLISHTPSSVTIDANGGYVSLDGKYTDIVINGMGGKVQIDSDSRYNVKLNGRDADVKLEGDIEVAEVEINGHGLIDIQATTTPKRLSVENNFGDVNIVLPENISGFNTFYRYGAEEQTFYSSFNVTSESIGEFAKKIQYGDGGTDIILNVMEGDTFISK